MTRKGFFRISVFYFIGIILSNIFRFDLLDLHKSEEHLSVLELLLTSPLGASGLLIGALVSLYLLKRERDLSYSLFGTSPKWSIIMMVIPITLMGIMGVKNAIGVNVHYYGVISGVGTFIYCFSEEMGWRGYLQDELKQIKEWQRVLLIGFLWYLWHLPFLTNQNPIDNLQFLGWMIFGSWGIGKVIDFTKSIIAAACFHMIVNILMFNPIMKNGIEGISKLIIIGISIALWVLILTFWGKENKTIANKV